MEIKKYVWPQVALRLVFGAVCTQKWHICTSTSFLYGRLYLMTHSLMGCLMLGGLHPDMKTACRLLCDCQKYVNLHLKCVSPNPLNRTYGK